MKTFSPNNLAPDITIDNLSLKYHHHRLFEQFNLRLPSGSWTCLLGASGVGKTTVLRLLAGLPTGVDYPVDPSAIRTSDGLPLKGRIAYMAQQDSLLPWLNVLNNTLLGYRLRGQTVRDSEKIQAKNLLKTVGLDQVMHLYPDQLSGGMRQRVALVRTFLEERPIVLMDEPFSALDAITRFKLQDLAAELLRGKTVLWVTHEPLEAIRLADQIYVLQGSPVRLSKPIIPPGLRPRDPAQIEILQYQARLLDLMAVNPPDREVE